MFVFEYSTFLAEKSEPSDGHQGHEDMGYSLDLYKGIHNMLEPVAASLLTAFDLGCHKTVLDLGGKGCFRQTFSVCAKNNAKLLDHVVVLRQ